jgi:hypothetical protein
MKQGARKVANSMSEQSARRLSHLGETAVSASCWMATLQKSHGQAAEPSSAEEGDECSDPSRVEAATIYKKHAHCKSLCT